mgnify:CR=1 FL=1
MNQEEMITEKMKNVAVLLKDLNAYFSQDNLSAKMIKWDVDGLMSDKTKLLEEMAIIKSQIDEAKKQGDEIIAKAKEKAEDIKLLIQKKFVEASADREAAAKELLDAKEKKYKAKAELV